MLHPTALAIALLLVVAPVSGATAAPSLQDILLDLSAGRAESALAKAESRVAAQPSEAKAHEALGRALYALGRYDQAVEAFFKALELDPTLHSVHFHLGEAAFAQRYWPEAIEFYQVHAAKTKGAPRTILKLVYCHIANGNLNEAGQWLAKLDPFDDSFPGYYFGKAAFAHAMGKKDEPAKLIQQARTLYGNSAANEFEVEMLHILKKDVHPSKDPARPKNTAQP
ncbi:MAG: tetratricopeptide repeat protein [Verrucomicrobiia bacterium]